MTSSSPTLSRSISRLSVNYPDDITENGDFYRESSSTERSLAFTSYFLSDGSPNHDSLKNETQETSPLTDKNFLDILPLSPQTINTSYLNVLSSSLQKKELRKFIEILSNIPNLHKYGILDIISYLNLTDDHEKFLSDLFQDLFSFNSEGICFALQLALENKKELNEDKKILLSIIYLCEQYRKYKKITPEESHLKAELSKLPTLKHISEDIEDIRKNIREKNHEKIEYQVTLIFSYIDLHYKYNPENSSLTIRESDKISGVIDLLEKELKRINQSKKGVAYLEPPQAMTPRDNIIQGLINNAANNMSTLIEEVGGEKGISTQNIQGLGANAFLFLTFEHFSYYWNKNSKKFNLTSLKQYEHLILLCLNKSVNTYKQIPQAHPLSPFLSQRLEKYIGKTRYSEFLKIEKFAWKFFRINKLDEKYVDKNLDNQLEDKNVNYLFNDYVKLLKDSIRILHADKDIYKFRRRLAKIKKVAPNALLYIKVFKVNKLRGTLLEHLLQIYKKYPNMQEFLREEVQFCLQNRVLNEEIPYQRNKNKILEANWRDRNAACKTINEMCAGILKNNSIPNSEKKLFLKGLIENLQDEKNTTLIPIKERRRKEGPYVAVRSTVFSLYIAGRNMPYFQQSLKSLSTSASQVAFWTGAASVSTFLINFLNLSARTKTVTYKSIITTLEGALSYVESLPCHVSTMEKDIDTIKDILIKNDNNKKLSSEDSLKIINILKEYRENQKNKSTLFKNNQSHRLSFILEHNHGRKLKLLFELMAKLNENDTKSLLKIYFTKEDLDSELKRLRKFIKPPKNEDESQEAKKVYYSILKAKGDYEKFSEYLSLSVQTAKHSKNDAAFLTIKGMAYLAHLQEETNGDQNKISNYNACKKKLENIILEAGDNRHSDFSILTLRKRRTTVAFKIALNTLTMTFWAFLATSVTNLPVIGIVSAIGLTLTGPGLPLGLGILAICGALRNILNALSESHLFTYSNRAHTYQFLRGGFYRLFDEENKNKKFYKYRKVNFRHTLDDINKNFRKSLENQGPHADYKQQFEEYFFENLIDSEKVKAINGIRAQMGRRQAILLFLKIKETMLQEHFDKGSILESLFRIVHIINKSDFNAKEKVELLESLFKEVILGKGNFNKLKLENNFIREKDWFIPHIFLGSCYTFGPFVAVRPIAPILQALTGMTGDIIAARTNDFINYPEGNTKSFQAAALLIKNNITALLFSNAEDNALLAKEGARIQRNILNYSTSRYSDFIKNAKSSQIYQKFAKKIPRLTHM